MYKNKLFYQKTNFMPEIIFNNYSVYLVFQFNYERIYKQRTTIMNCFKFNIFMFGLLVTK